MRSASAPGDAVTPGCFDSTALPDGPPHLIDRLDAAIMDGEEGLAWCAPTGKAHAAIRELLAVAREVRAVLDAEGFGR